MDFAKSRLADWLGTRLAVVFLGLCLSSQAASHITSPKEFLGHNIGDDYFLANYAQLTNITGSSWRTSRTVSKGW